MEPNEALALDEIDLSDMEFWGCLGRARGAFATLRRERPIAFFEDPDASASPLAPPPGPGYRVLTRYADVAEASRHPETYRSGQGAVSIIDLPPKWSSTSPG